MIHKIKSLYDDGHGLSMRQIAEQLKISRNTVKKYLEMNEEEITPYLSHASRSKELDHYASYIRHLLEKYPKLSSVKIRRKLEARELRVRVSERSLRRYIQELKQGVVVKQTRYYEPVLDMVAGVQCQVDAGELRQVLIGTKRQNVYFVVFVLSFSRLMYVGLSFKPINTERFIQMHDEAFRFFGGMPEECVYDQSKLVVIKEEFREVWFNEAFWRYATTTGLDIGVCEGYDPESKGKVESGVKYVKKSFFYGEEFVSEEEVRQQLGQWLRQVANDRIHGTTHQKPSRLYQQEEKERMKPYLRPNPLMIHLIDQSREVDKTSLISYQSSKYSVPQSYQSGRVLVDEVQGSLVIYDLYTGEEIARHLLCEDKGQIRRNNNHYRDYHQTIREHEQVIESILGESISTPLCALLKSTCPKIYKDQLAGLIQVLRSHHHQANLPIAFEALIERAELKVSFIKNYLQAFYSPRRQSNEAQGEACQKTGDLEKYAQLTCSNLKKQEVDYAIC